MRIERPRNRDLRRLIEKGDRSGIGADMVQKVSDRIAFLEAIETLDELLAMPHWHVHGLAGNRRDQISLRVTRNWRLTFRYDPEANAIVDLDLVDYH